MYPPISIDIQWLTWNNRPDSPVNSSYSSNRNSSPPMSSIIIKAPVAPKHQGPLPPTPRAQLRDANPDAWRPPEDWGCNAVEDTRPATIEELMGNMGADESTDMSLDLPSMQREVRRMMAASPQMILSRLKEQWGTPTDDALFKELEMERKRWMFSALHSMDRPSSGGFCTPRDRNILALFESSGKMALQTQLVCIECSC